MTTPSPENPKWYCVWCAATSLNPCDHSPIYHWHWDSKFLALADDGEPIRDKAARKLEADHA